MAGVKSYLVPSYSGTVSYISKGVPSLGGIGRIGGGGGLPSVGGMYQWMCTGISYVQKGGTDIYTADFNLKLKGYLR